MKVSPISLIAVMLVVIAVALAGCTGGSPAAPSGGNTQPAATTASGSSGSSGSQGSVASGADLFGNLNYNWVEYKMNAGSGADAMTIYYKYNRQTGKCSMRFEGAAASQIPAGMQEMDCTAKGSSQGSTADPNEINPDAKIDCALLEESVTVPAGTFSATKCTVTSQGMTSNTWIAKGKFLVKTETKTGDGNVNMVLNAYG
jgi:hypothetical protein